MKQITNGEKINQKVDMKPYSVVYKKRGNENVMKTYTIKELKKILELHAKWLRGDMSGERADLRGADLRGADLVEANLEGADLEGASGNNKEIKTIQADLWIINYTESVIQIGCKNYTIEEWFDFSDEIIKKMDAKALEFWKKWKPILELIGVFDKVKQQEGLSND